MDEFAQRLYNYGIGDLAHIAEFFGDSALEGAQDGLDALSVMYESLPFWDLLYYETSHPPKKPGNYIEEAITFFSYQRYLKEFERKKALKKIDRFEKPIKKKKKPSSPKNFMILMIL